MGSYINPFDAPLQSEIQEHQQAQAATLKASPTGNPFDEPLMSEKAEAAMTGSDTGAITNDVGNAVIMPKEGESFDETLRRAAAYRRTVAPQQTNAEMATAPKKVAQTLVAAPLIGAGGASGTSGPGELASGAEKLLQISENALEHLAENYPQLTKLATKLGYGVGATGAYKLLNKLGIH